MNDYEELIKRLRVAVDVHKVKGCALEISAETCAEIADAIEQLVRERDAAVKDMETIANNMLLGCEFCKKNCTEQANCLTGDARFEWRGVQND